MKNSISKKAGIIISAVLIISLSVMLLILLNIEENLKLQNTRENIDETSKIINESIIFAMAQTSLWQNTARQFSMIIVVNKHANLLQ